jgi:DMSO reductase anchor subunit
MFSAFSGLASLYAGMLCVGVKGSSPAGLLTGLLGAGGIFASASIYRVKARPAWNTRYTVAEFFLTGALLGPLFAAAAGAGEQVPLLLAATSVAVASAFAQVLKLFWLARSEVVELRASMRLISGILAPRHLLRWSLLIAGGVIFPLATFSQWTALAALLLALTGEVLGRYLFFVSVVPKTMAASYLAKETT